MKGLVLSGGGSRGAYQAGALSSLFKDEPENEYGFIAGVSVGAINAAHLAQAPIGDMAEWSRSLLDYWRGIKGNSDIWKGHWYGNLAALWKTGLRKTHPLREMMRERYDAEKVKASGRIVRYGAVDLLSGRYAEGTERSENPVDWIIRSSAFPIFFVTDVDDDGIWTDGGIRHITPLSTAIMAGCDSVDVVVTGPLKGRVRQLRRNDLKNTLQVATRCLEIMLDEIYINDLKMCSARNFQADSGVEKYKRVNVRVWAPPVPLEGDPLDFDPLVIRDQITMGEATEPVNLDSCWE